MRNLSRGFCGREFGLQSNLRLSSSRISRFLSNFAKRTFTVNDQVKIISDFLTASAFGASVDDQFR